MPNGVQARRAGSGAQACDLNWRQVV
jgi:hypothetical protein